MKHVDFNKLLDYRLKKIKKILQAKSDEYSTESDKLHNFKRAAQVENCSPEKALIGMFVKHLVSILDIVDETESKCGLDMNCFPAFETVTYLNMLDEKITDAINYFILLEALLKERASNVKGEERA